MGENFYQFWPRTVWGSLKSAWRLEKRRIARRGKHPFRIGNDVLNAWLMSAVLWGGLIAWLGVGITPYLLIQAVVGFSLLEVVNYMEHYGMLRQKVGSGDKQRYERVNPSHSWNSNNIATNVLALERGASVFRVHDVAPVREALQVAAATVSERWAPTTSSRTTTS